jgi:leader peptidase (prepilin peptidase)/N-methyltransferase
MLELLAGLFGLLIGSFLNVCIYRWPRDLSVVRPRSACTSCEKPIAWYDNVPVLSYLVLRGRCRQCGSGISWHYPFVELATGVAFAFFVHRYALTPEAAKYSIFTAIVIALVFTDLDTLLLPDELTLGGLIIGLGFAFLAPVPDSTFRMTAGIFGFQTGNVAEALAGAIVPAGSIWLGGWLFEKIRHKEGLGFGDVKMLAMIGAFLGISGALMTIMIGSIAGSVIGLIFIKATGKDASSFQLPFGSFLGAAGIFAAAEGPALIRWYLHTSP